MIEVASERLVYKVASAGVLSGVMDGDWDKRRTLIVDAVKYRSMVQHFVDGLEWESTDLFRMVFPKRLAGGLAFRGSFDMADIAAHYRRVIDPLFESLRRDGFLPMSLPTVALARDGEVLLGNQGNHRVAMAKIIGIKAIPCEVICRHALFGGHLATR